MMKRRGFDYSRRYEKPSYSSTGLFKATGPFWFVGAVFVLNLVVFTWFVYFFVKCAAHVGAWPFA